MSGVRCAACGEPGHRYGRNEGMDRFDPMACINGLRGRIEELEKARLTGSCEDDCQDSCAYPGQFSECEIGAEQ